MNHKSGFHGLFAYTLKALCLQLVSSLLDILLSLMGFLPNLLCIFEPGFITIP